MKANLQKEANRNAESEARQELHHEYNRIRGIFQADYGSMNLSIEQINKYISNFKNYDFSEFGDNELFASSLANDQVSFLGRLKGHLESKAREVDTPSKVETVHETIPMEQKEKRELKSYEVVEDGKKIVLVDVHLQFKVKNTIPDERIVAKVNQMLTAAGFDESLLGVEVVS